MLYINYVLIKRKELLGQPNSLKTPFDHLLFFDPELIKFKYSLQIFKIDFLESLRWKDVPNLFLKFSRRINLRLWLHYYDYNSTLYAYN